MSGSKTNTGTVSAWRFLKRNPDYIEAWRGAAEEVSGPEGAAFPVRTQTRGDLAAAGWGVLAWEDPLGKNGPASPFWADAPMLEAESAGGGASGLAELFGGARLAGLRLRDGALIVKIERGGSAVQLRIADGDGFDPGDGLVLRLGLGLDLPVALARARDLWAIAGARGRAGGGPPPRAGKASCSAPSTASWPANRTA